MSSSAPASVTAAVLVPSKADVTGLIPVQGYDFNKGVDFEALLNSYRTMGFQGSSLGDSIDEINRMVRSHYFPFLPPCLVPLPHISPRSSGDSLMNLALKTSPIITGIPLFASPIVARFISGSAILLFFSLRDFALAQDSLSYTSNLISSGLREVIRYLAQHAMVYNLI